MVILSQYADESYAFALLSEGTAGLAYLLKERVGEVGVLLAAIREVIADGSVVDPAVVQGLVAHRVPMEDSPPSPG